jgi:hypothetical protein
MTAPTPIRRRRRPLSLEEKFQVAVVELLQLYERRGCLVYAHIPNGLRRTKATGGRLKAMGVRPGVPDLVLWLPHGRLLMLELKWGKGEVSEAQAVFHRVMGRLGHCVVVCYTLEEVEEALRSVGVPALSSLRPLRQSA